MSCEGRVVCPDCGMSTWIKDFGCALPGCENYGVLAGGPVESLADEIVAEQRREDEGERGRFE